MTSNRREVRRGTVLYLQVVDNRSGEEIGRLTDLSPEGAQIVTTVPLPLNGEIQVRIVLPPPLASQQPVMSGTITPRWNRRDENPALFLNGCVLTVPQGEKETLNHLIQQYGFSSGTVDFRRKYESEKDRWDKESEDEV